MSSQTTTRRVARMMAHRFERMVFHFLMELGRDELTPNDPRWDLIPGVADGIEDSTPMPGVPMPTAPLQAAIPVVPAVVPDIEPRVKSATCAQCGMVMTFDPPIVASKAIVHPCPICGRIEDR